MANKQIAALILLSLFMVGCVGTPTTPVTRVETVEVYKPVFVVPDELKEFPVIQRPDLPTNHLTAEDRDNPGQVAKIVIESMAILREYAEALEDQIDGYKQAVKRAELKEQKNEQLLKD